MLSAWILAAVAAQSAVPATIPPPEPPGVVAQAIKVPALSDVQLLVLVDLQSKTAAAGQEFDLALSAPLKLADGYEIPAGTKGRGWVIHADRAKMGGRPGELLLGARYLEYKRIRIPLRSMKLVAGGKDQSGIATGLAVAGGAIGATAAMFITGGQARVANGAPATARTASDVAIPAALLERPAPSPLAPVPLPNTTSQTNQ